MKAVFFMLLIALAHGSPEPEPEAEPEPVAEPEPEPEPGAEPEPSVYKAQIPGRGGYYAYNRFKRSPAATTIVRKFNVGPPAKSLGKLLTAVKKVVPLVVRAKKKRPFKRTLKKLRRG